MKELTFEQLPQAVAELGNQVTEIKKLVLELSNQNHEKDRIIKELQKDEFMLIAEVANYMRLTIPTIYSKVCKKEIPSYKVGKQLYFSKKEINEYIKSGYKPMKIEEQL
jgi:excisionase family DNA binding protein